MLIVRPNTYVPGTIIRSTEVNDDFDTIYTDYNGNIDDDNIAAGANIAWTKIDKTGAVVDDLSGAVPIGSMIWFYDFNGLLTFDTNSWKYCNGQVTAVGGIGAQTLPDASNRYIVGFGTEAGADIGTAAWNVAPVGNANHAANLEHTHIQNTHLHTINHGHADTLTYSVPRHYHYSMAITTATDSHYHAVVMTSNTANVLKCTSDGSTNGRIDPGSDAGGANDPVRTATDTHSHGITSGATDGSTNRVGYVSGESADASTFDDARSCGGSVTNYAGNSGSTIPTNQNALSTTQDVQMRSIRARLLMRVA